MLKRMKNDRDLERNKHGMAGPSWGCSSVVQGLHCVCGLAQHWERRQGLRVLYM